MRSILITGGNGGLGTALGRHFLEREPDTRVWLGVRANRDRAGSVVVDHAGRCQLVDLDVTHPGDWQAAVAGIVEACGRIDVLVNNAGAHQDHPLSAMPQEDWDEVIRTNLDSVYHGCRAVVPAMTRQGHGRIINIAALAAVRPVAGQANYAAAKAGVVAFTRALAQEVARAGITVNAVLPGVIETEALASMPRETRRAALERLPMGRFASPPEVAAAIRFLASPEASYITGASLRVDGGA